MARPFAVRGADRLGGEVRCYVCHAQIMKQKRGLAMGILRDFGGSLKVFFMENYSNGSKLRKLQLLE